MTRMVMICLLLLICSCSRIEQSGKDFPADGISGGLAEITGLGNDEFVRPDAIKNDVIEITSLSPRKITFKSGGSPGKAVIPTKNGSKLVLTFYKIPLDSDGDGYPDQAEIINENDQAALRAWMVRIAESQFVRLSPAWTASQRDCAGLVRFAFREAMRRHDDSWNRRTGVVLDKNLPDIERFAYPDIPVIGENIFKISDASADERKSFAAFADASTLIRFSLIRVGHSLEDSLPGDCAVFENSRNGEWPYHMMIVCESENGERVLVYHTGDAQGVKRVRSSYLNNSNSFRPVKSNPAFLGIYRFKMME